MKRLSRAAVLIDGTALYFRSKEGRADERLNYEELNQLLLEKAGSSTFDPALFFTTYDAQNEGQAKFLAFLQNRLKWTVDARPVWDADPLPKDARWQLGEKGNQLIRFDASISFAVGRLVERRDTIVILTDSFAVAHPMLAAMEYENSRIILAFFGRQLDSRWFDLIEKKKIELWNLDDDHERLFGRERSPDGASANVLARLK